MPKLQPYFESYHDKIKLDDENDVLREKRDAVLDKLGSGLTALFDEKDEPAPKWRAFPIGSYAMNTGIKPPEGRDLDIDIGVEFEVAFANHGPVDTKMWVHDALDGRYSKKREVREPCVTVWYERDGEPVTHVDLAVYSSADSNDEPCSRLARGRPSSDDADQRWELSDTESFIAALKERHSGADAAQMRRCIRYLKRWRDEQFSRDGNGAPVGIALTLAVYEVFVPISELIDPFANTRSYDDARALRGVTQGMLSRFQLVPGDSSQKRMSMTMPVAPYDDPFRRMSDAQATVFHAQLKSLDDALHQAREVIVDPTEACALLAKHLGATDFPVPEKATTSQPRSRPVITSADHG